MLVIFTNTSWMSDVFVVSLRVNWEWINVIFRGVLFHCELRCHQNAEPSLKVTVSSQLEPWTSQRRQTHTHLQPPSKSSTSLHLDDEVQKVTAQMGTAQSCISFHHRLSLSFLFLFLFLPSGKQWQQLEGHCRDLQAGTVNSCSAELKNRRRLSCCSLFSKASVEQNFKCFFPPSDSSSDRCFLTSAMISCGQDEGHTIPHHHIKQDVMKIAFSPHQQKNFILSTEKVWALTELYCRTARWRGVYTMFIWSDLLNPSRQIQANFQRESLLLPTINSVDRAKGRFSPLPAFCCTSFFFFSYLIQKRCCLTNLTEG